MWETVKSWFAVKRINELEQRLEKATTDNNQLSSRLTELKSKHGDLQVAFIDAIETCKSLKERNDELIGKIDKLKTREGLLQLKLQVNNIRE